MSAPHGHIISRRWPVAVFGSSAAGGTPNSDRQPAINIQYCVGDARCRVEIRRDTGDGNGRGFVALLDFDEVGDLINTLQQIAPRMPAQEGAQP